MPRIIRAREQAEMLKTAEDLTTTLAPPPATTTTAPSIPPTSAPDLLNPPPPTMTDIPRSQFDKILASKGVTYDQHLDNLESHFDAATEDQKRRGRVWYRAGGDTLRDIGQKFKMSTNRAIAMAAALSSRTDWNNNLHYAAHMAGNYRPGENEDEWRRANIHPSALARYMENRHGIVPGDKAPDDPTNPAHFSIKELKGLHKDGYMPRTKADFEVLANAHGGNHWQYNPDAIDPKTGKKGRWVNAPLRGFEELQTDEGRAAWLNNAQMSMRGDIRSSPNRWNPLPRRKKGEPEPPVEFRKPWEDAIDGHMRQVRDSKSPYGFTPTSAYTGAGVPTLGGNIEKAKLLSQVSEDEFDQHLNGQKYRAFFSNLGNKLKFLKASHPQDQGYYDLGGKHWTEIGRELLRSTVDTQHMRAASQPHGSSNPAPGYSESSLVTERQYEVYQQGLVDLTHRINSKRPRHKHLLPHQVQAIIWGKFKDDQKDKKNGAGQTFFSPTMDDIQPFADRYSLLRVANHVDPRLLEHPLSNPYETDSDQWFDAVMDSWEAHHQHELAPQHGEIVNREVQAARDVLARVDKLAGGGYDNPWEGPDAEGLSRDCPYCDAPAFDMHQVDCPSLYTDTPGIDKQLLGPNKYEVPFAEHPSFRLNSILAYTDRLLHISGKPASGALYILLPHWDPEACAAILHSHAAAQQGRTAAPLMDKEWMGDVMDAAHQGGFTLHDHVGDGPTSGYMVSLYKDSEFKTPIEHLTADHVRDFVDANSDALSKPHHYLGGWLEGGHFYLDVSTHVPEMNRATTEAVRNRQLGIYDLNNQRTIHTDEAGWLTGHPGVVGSRDHGQRAAAVSPAAQGRPAAGGRHPAEGRRSAADDAPERHLRVARHLDSYLPPGGL